MSAALGALVLAALMVGGAAGPAAADKDKDCATVVVGPGNSGMTGDRETDRSVRQLERHRRAEGREEAWGRNASGPAALSRDAVVTF